MRFALAADAAYDLVEVVAARLELLGHEVQRLPVADWVAAGRGAAEAVAQGHADRAVVICWTGTGVSIAANKVPGVRAALCSDAATAAGARRWNDANVLALGARSISAAVGQVIVDAFCAGEPDADELPVIARLS